MSETITAVKAARDIRAVLRALQRARSAIAESLSEDKVEISKEVLPWIMGQNGDALLKTLDGMLHYTTSKQAQCREVRTSTWC